MEVARCLMMMSLRKIYYCLLVNRVIRSIDWYNSIRGGMDGTTPSSLYQKTAMTLPSTRVDSSTAARAPSTSASPRRKQSVTTSLSRMAYGGTKFRGNSAPSRAELPFSPPEEVPRTAPSRWGELQTIAPKRATRPVPIPKSMTPTTNPTRRWRAASNRSVSSRWGTVPRTRVVASACRNPVLTTALPTRTLMYLLIVPCVRVRKIDRSIAMPRAAVPPHPARAARLPRRTREMSSLPRGAVPQLPGAPLGAWPSAVRSRR
mmetsp:Transcript_5109/g.9150  ORF Transcript_5109/g.9150 Transcript_5109/m.9150 type:complete len:261 (-) Transcript_5109:1319-2101(-)